MPAPASIPKLRLKNALADPQFDQALLGTFVCLPGVRNAQSVASSGLDTIIVDCEHGNISDAEMHDVVCAIAACGVSPIVRIRGPEMSLIKRALDTGAHGIMVPQINTAAEAAQIVQWSKFPPTGTRGQGTPFAAINWGLTTPEYIKAANDNVVLMLQIETPEGLKNCEEIAKVPGVDMLFIGPNDLALSTLGYVPARGDEPTFVAALHKVANAARAAGKTTGILVTEGSKVAASRATYGFDLYIISTEVKGMIAWYAQQVADGRKH